MTDDFIIRRYVIALSVFTFLIVGGLSYITQLVGVDSSMVDEKLVGNFTASLDTTLAIQNQTGSLFTLVKDTNSNGNFFNVLWSISVGLWGGLKSVFMNIGLATSVIGASFNLFAIPVWVYTFIASVLSILLLFALISFVIGRNT